MKESLAKPKDDQFHKEVMDKMFVKIEERLEQKYAKGEITNKQKI